MTFPLGYDGSTLTQSPASHDPRGDVPVRLRWLSAATVGYVALCPRCDRLNAPVAIDSLHGVGGL